MRIMALLALTVVVSSNAFGREMFQPSSVSGWASKAAPARGDQADDFLIELQLRSLEAMEATGLMSAKLSHQPWSGDYWAMTYGLLAYRYNDPGFPRSDDWKANVEYTLKSRETTPTDLLSPAEKYDLLVGDESFGLTKVSLEAGQRHYARRGEVELWMGICEGWAAASYAVERPEREVRALAADGKSIIRFFPDDIKGLITLLWARTDLPTIGISGRCEAKTPADRRNAACRDTNPGTWHLVVVHQIGIENQSFVMDASVHYEVWNHPVFAYEYRYLNPRTQERANSLNEASIRPQDFPEDPLRSLRAPQTASIVTIEMDVRYIDETAASDRSCDSPQYDRIAQATYVYDLELDSGGNIIGGEWRSEAHPDFLWKIRKGASPYSIGDLELDLRHEEKIEWNPNDQTVPESWRKAAHRASQAEQPMARIVDALIRHSRGKE